MSLSTSSLILPSNPIRATIYKKVFSPQINAQDQKLLCILHQLGLDPCTEMRAPQFKSHLLIRQVGILAFSFYSLLHFGCTRFGAQILPASRNCYSEAAPALPDKC